MNAKKRKEDVEADAGRPLPRSTGDVVDRRRDPLRPLEHDVKVLESVVRVLVKQCGPSLRSELEAKLGKKAQ